MSDWDPFAPKTVITPKPPRASLQHPPLGRMRRLGASRIVLAELERRWAMLDQAERRHAFDNLDAMSDDELRHAFDEMEVETVAAQAWPGADEAQLGLAVEALSEVPDGSVKRITEWADRDDGPSALAALTVEYRQPPNQQRSTLIEAMEAALHGR